MYISIDIETTGLDPERCQVLELAAVAWDNDDVNKCSTFACFVDPRRGEVSGVYGDMVVGEPYALNMNARILNSLARGIAPWSVAKVCEEFQRWLTQLWLSQFGGSILTELNAPDKFFTPLGKNFGAFDWQFLKRMPGFPIKAFRHRSLEVGTLYATKDGIPSSGEIFEGIPERWAITGNAHEALYDAKCTLAAAMEKLA